MPAIAPIEDLRAAQKELLETQDINELKKVFKKYRRIGWKNICKLWLEESTPEKLKGEEHQIGEGWELRQSGFGFGVTLHALRFTTKNLRYGL